MKKVVDDWRECWVGVEVPSYEKTRGWSDTPSLLQSTRVRTHASSLRVCLRSYRARVSAPSRQEMRLSRTSAPL